MFRQTLINLELCFIVLIYSELISGGLCHSNKTIEERFLCSGVRKCDIHHAKYELIS
ncbi:hypothetical protein VIBNIAM115_1400009 [Vibrio nigripulchritudo AM115]|nr:hypothetical protein VIBNIAM115_1400009 [Vibrio nigripulchritudo AM115]